MFVYDRLCGFEPYLDEKSQVPTTGKIINGDYAFPSPWWDEISDSAKELITRVKLLLLFFLSCRKFITVDDF